MLTVVVGVVGGGLIGSIGLFFRGLFGGLGDLGVREDAVVEFRVEHDNGLDLGRGRLHGQPIWVAIQED